MPHSPTVAASTIAVKSARVDQVHATICTALVRDQLTGDDEDASTVGRSISGPAAVPRRPRRVPYVWSLSAAHGARDARRASRGTPCPCASTRVDQLIEHIFRRFTEECRVREQRLVALAIETRDVPDDVLPAGARL